MRIVVAPDGFKDCCTAWEAADAIVRGLRRELPDAEVIVQPMADGGEGTAEVLRRALGGQWVETRVCGPLRPYEVEAGYVWNEERRLAIVEMARASGLELLTEAQRDPLQTTSYGTGQLIQQAIEQGAQRILLAVGGSASVDLGLGMARALGWTFWDEHHREVTPIGKGMLQVDHIQRPLVKGPDVEVQVLCDVLNPLLGPDGAAAVFGPQKGASRSDVVLLEVGLTHMARLIEQQFDIKVDHVPGGGAAGGLAAGAMVFLNATLVSGVEAVIRETGLGEHLAGADVVITGEGRLDAQSFHGKVVGGVAEACRSGSAQVVVLAGQIHLNEEQLRAQGVHRALACSRPDLSREQSLRQGVALIEEAAAKWARDLNRAGDGDTAAS